MYCESESLSNAIKKGQIIIPPFESEVNSFINPVCCAAFDERSTEQRRKIGESFQCSHFTTHEEQLTQEMVLG